MINKIHFFGKYGGKCSLRLNSSGKVSAKEREVACVHSVFFSCVLAQNINVIGQSLPVHNGEQVTVTGVWKNDIKLGRSLLNRCDTHTTAHTTAHCGTRSLCLCLSLTVVVGDSAITVGELPQSIQSLPLFLASAFKVGIYLLSTF